MLLINMELKTKSLILRELKESDAQSIAENANNVNVSKYLLAVSYPYSLKDAESFIHSTMEAAKKVPRTQYDFGITLGNEREAVGMISVEKIKIEDGSCTIGYWLGEGYHRKRYMTEAFGRVIEFSFMELKLNRINIAAFAENEGSNTLIHNAKFELDRTLKQHVRDKATGSLHDENHYYLLRDRYMSGKRSKG